MTEMDIAALRLTAQQFGELAATIYAQMYETLRAQGIPKEKLDAMAQHCFTSMVVAVANVVEKKLGNTGGLIDEAVARLMAQAVRSSALGGGHKGN